MKTALVLMTILGCDDTAVQCHYIDTVDRQWASIQACDADSESNLDRFTRLDYPVVVAVCETTAAGNAPEPDKPANSAISQIPVDDGVRRPSVEIPVATEGAAIGDESPAPADDPALTERIRKTMARVLPSIADAKTIAVKPVHFVTDTYAWVAKRVRLGSAKD